MTALIALIALTLEAAFGYPGALYRKIGHPVSWIGALITWCDRRWNAATAPDAQRRNFGVLTLLLVVAAAILVAAALTSIAPRLFGVTIGTVLIAAAASTLIAQRSLDEHVVAVARALEQQADPLPAARAAVSRIVGRDTQNLGEAAISRAAIESLAENFSDGIVAPVFWLTIAGLPAAAAYKAVNTADSMIGHLNPKYRQFGWAAARTDDLLNLPASRLSAVWLTCAASTVSRDSARAALAAALRDAPKHRSPNAGWPEAAMAGALGLQLAGPRVYSGQLVEDAYMGDGRREAAAADIRRALALYRRACAIQAVALGFLAALTMLT